MPTDTIEVSKTADTIARLIADADAASNEINSMRREVTNEYNERLRKLRDLKFALHTARLSPREELFDVAAIMSPELTRLLADPCHDL